MKTRSIAFLAASLLALSVSQPGFAQEDSSATPNEADAAPADQPESEKPDPDQPESEQPESEQQDAAAQEQKTPPAEGEDAADEGEETGTADAAAPTEEGSAKASAEGAGEPKTGPGGKPLRDDYPGTEESKKARMDTDRIEGLDFEEGAASDEVYDVRIRELETKVDDLKEKVFRSKSRIVLLKETVLTGNLAGSRAIVSHENALSGAYVLKRALYALDGSRVFNKVDEDGSLDDAASFELYNGSIAPGNHRLSILLELKGTGYGLFSYMDGYKFTIKDSCEFSAQEGRSTVLQVRLINRAGALSSYEKRPGVECVVNSVSLSGDTLDMDLNEKDGGDKAPSNKDSAASK